jgi:SAM-dependent methyltransferase
MAYADFTTRDRSPIKRWLHKRRLADALKVFRNSDAVSRPRVLDFGAGDGELVRRLASMATVEAFIFEPTPSLMAEAKEKLAGLDSIIFADRLETVESEIFDYVFCLEVFEHLPEKETLHAVGEIHRLLKPHGVAVIGVPHELFLPAILKGLFRVWRRPGKFDATFKNILAASCGRPPLHRPIAEIAPGVSYHFHHLGFDYRILERMLQDQLKLVDKWFSPFPILGFALNSEVYFLFRKS